MCLFHCWTIRKCEGQIIKLCGMVSIHFYYITCLATQVGGTISNYYGNGKLIIQYRLLILQQKTLFQTT